MECVECGADITQKRGQTELQATMQHYQQEHGYFTPAED